MDRIYSLDDKKEIAMLIYFQRFKYIKYQLVNLRKNSILVEY